MDSVATTPFPPQISTQAKAAQSSAPNLATTQRGDSVTIAADIQGQPGGSNREWVHMGINEEESVFDGRWRLVRKGEVETLIDARDLPDEKVADPATDSEAKAAKERLSSLLDSLK